MTDPSTPNNPKSRRAKGREPQTIDLTATVIPEEAETVAAPAAEPEAPGPAGKPDSEEPAATREAAPERKAPGSGKAAIAGLIFGLIGGVAGAAALLALQKPATTVPPALETRLAAIEARLNEPPPDSAAPLAPRLGSVEAEIQSISSKIGAVEAEQQTLRKALQTAGGKVDALAEMVRAAQTANQDNAGQDSAAAPEIEQRLGALDSAQAAIQSAQNRLEEGQRTLAPLAGKVDMLEKQVAAVARQAVDPMPAVRYALTTRLDQAVASGKPYANAIGALLKAGVAESDLADIAAFAGTGAPTAAQLKAEFKDPSQAIIAAERSQSGESFTDKLARMGSSVLRIRPSADTQGSDLPSLIVRIEAALDRGAFVDAAQIWNTLPDAARQLSAAWGKRITDRAKAASALAALNDKAVTALEGSVR